MNSSQPMHILEGSQYTNIGHLIAYQVEGDLHQPLSLTVGAEQRSLFELLQPISDASHTRDRKQSPPDSACMPGTRLEVVGKVNIWANSPISTDTEPHICWMHGYVGSGKSAISQEVCDKSERQDRPVASFFFFRNAGDRSKIWRLATTLASQMATVIPETGPFMRAAVRANPDLLNPDEAGFSVRARMQRLVYAPFKAAVQGGTPVRALAQGPFLIVLDGLDECDDKDEVQELIDGMLLFFTENPFIPLRVFITSRVEQHIQSHLNVPGVRLENLVDHCSDDDIATCLQVLFEDGCRRNPVIQAYVRQHGSWPTPKDRRKLVDHIGGSFIFASAVFKFIMGSNTQGGHRTTPIDRLPLALEMNPGLDELYAQTLAQSEHLPHFTNIISTTAMLFEPLPTSGIAEVLGINTYEVVNVLVNLQAIIQVPGTDDLPVTFCHTSLRDFLTTQSRSRCFFVHPSHHVRLFLRCLECELKLRRRKSGSLIHTSELTFAVAYALKYSTGHLNRGEGLFNPSESRSGIQLCREALELYPGVPTLVDRLANAIHGRARHTGSIVDLEEAVSLYREALRLQELSYPNRPGSHRRLGSALLDRYLKHTGTMADLEEAIFLYREALKLHPSPHTYRTISLHNLAGALVHRYWCTKATPDLEEAISLYREVLALEPSPHTARLISLKSLVVCLQVMYQQSHALPHLQAAIAHYSELLESYYPVGHQDRIEHLSRLTSVLQMRFDATGEEEDLAHMAKLKEEIDLLLASKS